MLSRDDVAILWERTLSSAGTSAIIALAFDIDAWLPIVSAILALMIETVRRYKRDTTVETIHTEVVEISKRFDSLHCQKALPVTDISGNKTGG
jgi:hypothetical protein